MKLEWISVGTYVGIHAFQTFVANLPGGILVTTVASGSGGDHPASVSTCYVPGVVARKTEGEVDVDSPPPDQDSPPELTDETLRRLVVGSTSSSGGVGEPAEDAGAGPEPVTSRTQEKVFFAPYDCFDKNGVLCGTSVLSKSWSADGVLMQLQVDGCPVPVDGAEVRGWPGDSFEVVWEGGRLSFQARSDYAVGPPRTPGVQRSEEVVPEGSVAYEVRDAEGNRLGEVVVRESSTDAEILRALRDKKFVFTLAGGVVARDSASEISVRDERGIVVWLKKSTRWLSGSGD